MYKSIKELFTAIADELRERLDIEGKIPTQDMPQRVQDLYFTSFNNGRDTGESIGYTRGYSEGEIKGREQGLTVGEEQGKAEVYAQIETINTQLENTLNGTDTGGKSFYDLVYQDITITQDCTNSEQLAEIFNTVVSEDEEIVMFINQNWTSYPDSSTPNNAILNAMIYSSKYRDEESIVRSGYFIRWRDGEFGVVAFLNTSYDVNVKAGDVFRKVVLRWKNI